MCWGRKNPSGCKRRVFSTLDRDWRLNTANGPSDAKVPGRLRLQRRNTAYQSHRLRENIIHCSWYVASVKYVFVQQEKHESSLNPRNLPRRRQDAMASASAPQATPTQNNNYLFNSLILTKLLIFILSTQFGYEQYIWCIIIKSVIM